MSVRPVSAIAAVLLLAPVAQRAAAEPYVPPPAESVSRYSTTVFACKISRDDDRTEVTCKDDFLEKQSLRDLSILRNTIYARYGWDGFRKPWLRDYFHAQPWFRPNPKFSYRLLNAVDKKNGHFIAAYEHSLTGSALDSRKDNVLARRGNKIEALTAEDKIELGLIARASGSFALDNEARGKVSESLDRLLTLDELRQLSLRDLRLLRNTIYARRGRTFKSQILTDHFAGMKWYKVDPNYSDKLLTDTDNRNVALIKSVENEFGGPMKDQDWLVEPAIDGA